ncbi:MAG: response regulator transcription factor, partial [Actinomycetota bacterium]
MTIRVVIADDHGIWRSGLRADLGANFTVVGEAGDATEAIAVIEQVSPDLVLSDLNMPNGGGLAVVKAVSDRFPVVILTVSEAESDLLEAVASGALGYLVKSTTSEELRDHLWRASKGEPVFSPSLAALVLSEFRRVKSTQQPADALSSREREVLQLVARGHTYKEIGEELYISAKTVENHVRN